MLITSFFIFFFFSSRRRHTRLVSDWSSDVCSSDLAKAREMVVRAAERAASLGANAEAQRAYERSEERRVGKECRSRWSRDQYKRKDNNTIYVQQSSRR